MTFEGPAPQGSELPAPDDGAGVLALADLISQARQQSERWITEDPVYAELMGTYAQLGETLLGGPVDPWFEADCESHVSRLAALGKVMDSDMADQIVAAVARSQSSKGAS